jgi:hypothetical protein
MSIKDAVRAHIFELAVESAKAITANVSEPDLLDVIDEALRWARESQSSKPLDER